MKSPFFWVPGATVTALFVLLWANEGGVIVVKMAHTRPIDVATLMLTAASLVVTGVGVIVAVVTFWGFKEIKEASVAAAKQMANETIRTYIGVVTAGESVSAGQSTTPPAAPAPAASNSAREVESI